MLEELQTARSVPLLVTLLFGVTAAVTDWQTFKIPNWITAPLLLGGLLFHALAPDGQGLAYAGLGMVAGFACLVAFYVMGGIGAGDVKLLAAAGSWLGPQLVFLLFLVAALLAAVYAVGLSLREGRLQQNVQRVVAIVNHGIVLVRHVGVEEQVEVVAGRAGRARRLVPFAVMILGAMTILVAWKFAAAH